jgi:hypothetical protein
VGAVRLGGDTGPWLLRIQRSADEVVVVLRAGDPQSMNERRRFGVESNALIVAEQGVSRRPVSSAATSPDKTRHNSPFSAPICAAPTRFPGPHHAIVSSRSAPPSHH